MKEKIAGLDHKPTMLLHVCCGPCLCIPLTYLYGHFDITIMYNNSNIYPASEYVRRRDEMKRYLKDINISLPIVEPKYDNEAYNKCLEPHKDDIEGRTRCFICYEKRITEAFEYAEKNGFEYVCSVMSISRYKNAQKINEIGYRLETKFPTVKWLPCDFKKENGYENELVICKKFNLYFQEYCGCKYSYKKYLEKQENKAEK